MSTVILQHASGATAQIHHQGAHVASWKTADGQERLFLSERAEFKPGVAIRGGVPIIFPQFAALGPLPKHGFARTLAWQFNAADSTSDIATFTLTYSPETLAVWPFRFAAIYQVKLDKDQLNMQLSVKNEDEKEFSFMAALHTYLRVADINGVSIHGLRGCRYRDSANGNVEHVESNDSITFTGNEVDRVYFSTPSPIVVNEPKHTLHCSAQGFIDTVVWNPGAVLSKKLTDMDDDGYRCMVCVEAATIGQPVLLSPAQQWQGAQSIVVR